jgi:hypothetical protein
VIDETILSESHERRISLIKGLGHGDVEDVAYRLRLLVNECLDNIQTAHHNLPPRKYKNSNKFLTIKVPSQRLKDIEKELSELIAWFKGGRKPRSRKWVSRYAIAAMVGHPPFGKAIFVVTKHKVTRIVTASRGFGRLRLDSKQAYFWDMLSTDEAIIKGQIELYANLRDEDGKPLYFELIPLDTDWPDSFERLAQRCRRLDRILLKDLESALSHQDFQRMAAGTTEARSIVQFMRGSSGKTTIDRWARCEPAFALITAMLDVVWPYSKGQPRASTLGELRAEGSRSERELLSDLAQNLVDLTQEKLDASPEFQSENYERVRAPKHFLGDSENYTTKADEILRLILSLREELVAYYVTRHTITEICEAALQREDDEEIRAAADCIIGPVVDKIESRLAARRTFLNFGADHLRENAFKWCGRLDPSARKHWRGEDELAGMAFPVTVLDRDRHLALYDSLVGSLELSAEEKQAWTKLMAWARTEGRGFWRVAVPELDERRNLDAESLS